MRNLKQKTYRLKSLISQSLICLLIFALASSAKAQDKDESDKKYPGLLWEVNGNGAKTPSYLYGTMHVSNKLAFNLNDSLFYALEGVDAVGTESNSDNWMRYNFDPSGWDYGSDYRSSNEEDLYSAFNLTFPDIDFFSYILKTERNVVNSFLYRSSDEDFEYEEDTYLDLFLFQAAKKMGKEYMELENFLQSQIFVLKSGIIEEDESSDPGLSYSDRRKCYENLRNYYRDGNLDAIDSVYTLINSPNEIKYMLIERNKLMVNTIDSIIQAGSSILAAAGAAHLPGDSGMIEMLKQMGYTVRVVKKNITDYSRDRKEELEDKIYSGNQFEKRYLPDSSISFILPGDIYSVYQRGYERYFCPDMANGAYYEIIRINTYASIEGKTTEDYLETIDGLLYENIPGKIISKEQKTINGYPCIDVTNKTRTNDYQRYCFIICPMEIVIVKLAGKRSYAISEHGEQFFNSIQLHIHPTDQWAAFSPEYGVFEISLPQNMIVKRKNVNNPKISYIESVQAIDSTSGNHYMLTTTIYHDYEYLEEDTFELNMFERRINKELEDYEKVSDSLMTTHLYPSKYVLLKKDSDYLHLKFIITGARYYMLSARTLSESMPEEFFNSFRLKPIIYNYDFIQDYDSNGLFSVRSTPQVCWSQTLHKAYNEVKKINSEIRKKNSDSYWSNKYRTVLTSYKTGEKVYVELNKLNQYFFKDSIHGYFEEIIEQMTDENDNLNLLSQKFSQDENTHYVDFVIGQPATSRIIKNRIILFGKQYYIISAYADTINLQSAFYTTFLETFTPFDTTAATNNTMHPFEQFFVDFNSTDSTTKAIARGLADDVEIGAGYTDHMISLIAASFFDEEETELKADIIEMLQKGKAKKVVRFLRKYYYQVEDTAMLQLAILKTLAKLQTVEATKAFRELIISRPPFTSSSGNIRSLFYTYYDSMELVQHLFPDILELAIYEDYRSSVYSLMALALKEKVIKPGVYKSDLNQIVNLGRIIYLKSLNKTGYSYGYYDNSWEIRRYIALFLPYYSKRQVSELVEKMLRSGNEEIVLAVVKEILLQGKEVTDVMLTNLAQSDTKQYDFLSFLSENNLVDKVGRHQFKDSLLARSRALGSKLDFEKDSVKFLQVNDILIKNETFKVYFFAFKKEDEKKWSMTYVAIPWKDGDFVFDKEVYWKRSISLKYGDTYKSLISEKNEYLYLKGRQRVGYNPG